MKNWAKNVVNMFAIVFFLIPVFAMADNSITFSPTSPDVYDGLNDPQVTCGAAGNNGWVWFMPDGSFPSGAPSRYYGTNWNGTSCAGQPMSATDGFSLATFLGGAGTITWIYFDNTVPAAFAACGQSTTASQAACEANQGGTPYEVTYTLTSPSPPPPPPPASIDAAVANATSSFEQTFGFSMDGVSNWMWDNLGQPIVGSGLGTFVVLRWQILSLIAMSIIIFFCFSYFRFFRQ